MEDVYGSIFLYIIPYLTAICIKYSINSIQFFCTLYMENLDNLVIRNKIIEILKDNDEINSQNCEVNEIVKQIKAFMLNMETFSTNLINLIKTLSNVNQPAIINDSNISSDVNDEVVQNISYDKYLKLSLPLHVIYFIKKYSDGSIKFPKYVSITNYHNLIKEEEYKLLRQCHQVILMWKSIGNGHYIILSIILADINETNFNQKRYFISHVGGSDITECEYNWNAFNKININKLINNDRLKTLNESIYDLITITDFSKLD